MLMLDVDTRPQPTTVAAHETGRQVAITTIATIATTSAANFMRLGWTQQQPDDRLWAINDCRRLPRRLERDRLSRRAQTT